jgi:4-hydroxy-4-methyl-2-oxoglutarate aldolase
MKAPTVSSTKRLYASVCEMLKDLRKVDTSALCDADKTLVSDDSEVDYVGLKLMKGLSARNNIENGDLVMAGIARTVQLDEPDDFLAVIRGLNDARADEVLVVNTRNSTRAVAGELFCAEATRKGLAGIIIDGPARDSTHLRKYSSVRFYSKSLSPYSGTIQSPGNMQQSVECGDALVHPGDIVVGDLDGILVGRSESFQRVLLLAKTIQGVEEKIREGILNGTPLVSMTNFQDHLERRLRNEPSALEFRV